MIQAYGNGLNKVVLDFERNYVHYLIPLDGNEARGVCVTFVHVQNNEWANTDIIAAAKEEEDPAVEYCIQLNTIDTCPLGLMEDAFASSSSRTYRGMSGLHWMAIWTICLMILCIFDPPGK